ncbi:MAG: helix-turn-helix transcriptional regulator [Oscillatoria sp. SIO1A7]|nr:helix-turn-helix transcriptional regulator [Oscillatoria sp. SIO1A7]
MSRSLRVDPSLIEQVKFAVKRKGYPSQKALALEMGLSRVTVTSFLNGRPVDFLNFTEICEELGLDWQKIAYKDQLALDWQGIAHQDFEDDSEIAPEALSTTSDEKPPSPSKGKLLVKLTIPMDEFDERQLQSIFELLRQIPGNSSMTIEKIEKV